MFLVSKTLLSHNVIMMGSQKVPWMVVLHSNCRTYGNSYLITVIAGPLHTHTCTHICAPSILPLLQAPVEASVGIFQSSSITFHLMSSMVMKRVPLRPIFRVGNSRQFLGAKSGECDGWVMCVLVQKPLSLPATCHAASSAKLAQQHIVWAVRTHSVRISGTFLLSFLFVLYNRWYVHSYILHKRTVCVRACVNFSKFSLFSNSLFYAVYWKEIW
jgi:hypothetical protein